MTTMTVKILSYPDNMSGIAKTDAGWVAIKNGVVFAPITGTGSRLAAINSAGTNRRLKVENGVMVDA